MQVRGEGDRVRSLNVRGEDIWEGTLAQMLLTGMNHGKGSNERT